MCMCGGIIEVGLIAAIVGYVGKRLHKCECKCHEDVHSCKHCENESIKEKRKYKIVQYILGAILFVGIALCIIGAYKEHCIHEHSEHCIHHHLKK